MQRCAFSVDVHWPSAYIQLSSSCAGAYPWSAALRNHPARHALDKFNCNVEEPSAAENPCIDEFELRLPVRTQLVDAYKFGIGKRILRPVDHFLIGLRISLHVGEFGRFLGNALAMMLDGLDVLPVPGPPTRTTLCASSRSDEVGGRALHSPRCWRSRSQ